MRDPEYNRLAINVAEMALELKDAWKAYGTLRFEVPLDNDKLDSALQTISLWRERYDKAVDVLWKYREQQKGVTSC